MRKSLMMGLIAVCCLVLPPAHADDEYSIEDKIEKMKSDLKLTDEQAKSIKPVIQEYADKIHEARKEKEEKLDKILTADQKDTLTKYKEEYKEEKMKSW